MLWLSLTTWSLHRNLGPLRWTRWDEAHAVHVTEETPQPELHTLLELPGILADKGFKTMEVCHFQFPDTGEAYLKRLRDAFRKAGIRFHSLLIDYGDISSADEVRRNADMAWIRQWIDRAALAGAERVRIIAGDADPTNREALQRSADALGHLAGYAAGKGVRVVTENFRRLASTAGNCLALVSACGGRIGLTSDFGNYQGPDKYRELSLTVPKSESIHAKAVTDANGMPDAAEFRKCMDIVKHSGYSGPITLVYDGPNDMWEGIGRLQALAAPYL